MSDGLAPGGAITRSAGVNAGSDAQVERLIAVVEYCLCEMFPADFFRRCAFTAFVLRALLQDRGIEATMIGGQFAAFVMTPDGARMAVQGFDRGPEPYPHLWVEANGCLIDLGPYLLPFGSEYPVAPMPALIWDMGAPLPAALRYKTHDRLPGDARISANPGVRAQCDAFLDRCRMLAADESRAPVLPNWIATGPASLAAAIGRSDPWACGAKRFESLALNHPLPF
jgi:hypothetical protein